MKNEAARAFNITIVRDALIKIAHRYYNPKYHGSIIDRSRVELISNLLDVLGQKSTLEESRILDVGCGKADLLVCLGELGAKNLVGVNLFPLPAECFTDERYVEEIFGDKPGKIKYVQCDIDNEQLPFPTEKFDAVLLVDVLEHLNNPGFALKEISRMLKNGGALSIRTPNCASLKNRIRMLSGKSPYHDLKGWVFDHRLLVPNTSEKRFQGHIREYTVEELRQLLNYFGLKLLYVKLRPAEHAPYRKAFLKIYNILERLYPRFAYHVLVIAIKDSSTNVRGNMLRCHGK